MVLTSQGILMELIEELLNLCHQHKIELWTDWGTMLGYYRHGNVIPWDNDGDFCLLSHHYVRLLQNISLVVGGVSPPMTIPIVMVHFPLSILPRNLKGAITGFLLLLRSGK